MTKQNLSNFNFVISNYQLLVALDLNNFLF
jgi:hypothetical protein